MSSEPLVCDQIECHPFLDQSRLIVACRRHGMAVVAYSPLARGEFYGNEVLTRIGASHKKTAAQICLRFLVQQNVVVIPRTGKLERLSENAAIFDFNLDDAEIGEIATLASRDGRFVDWAYPVRMQWD
jgi:diketogulonate reductase-like aldo/keto reductase